MNDHPTYAQLFDACQHALADLLAARRQAVEDLLLALARHVVSLQDECRAQHEHILRLEDQVLDLKRLVRALRRYRWMCSSTMPRSLLQHEPSLCWPRTLPPKGVLS